MAQNEVQQPVTQVVLHPDDPERRWIHTLLVVSTITVSLILVGLISNILVYFSDILLVFFLSWLLAFVLSPIVSGIIRTFPTLPRGLVTILIYLIIMVVLTTLVVQVAASLSGSISTFVAQLPDIQARLPEILQPWQARLNQLGLTIDLAKAAQDVFGNLGSIGGNLVGPLTGLAAGLLGIFGNFLLIVFLSLFMVIDKDRLIAFFNRIVPPRYGDDMRLFETSVANSFGGFIRGQVIQGLIYGSIAFGVHVVFNIDFGPASAALVGILQAIPFFGPFFSWAPPVVAAALQNPGAVIPALVVMAIGWFVVMNIVQPRVMASAVGIHPIAVLGSVLIGLKLAGVAGAIFGLPIAAVISSIFFHYLNRSTGGPRDVAHRAARRIEKREGRQVRVPTAPHLGTDASGIDAATSLEVAAADDASATAAAEAHEQAVREDPLADALAPPAYAERTVDTEAGRHGQTPPKAGRPEASEAGS
jgi:predicted PurR-regulated permease PerM